jgi:hypothetical protein
LKSSTCNREEDGDLAAGYVGLLGVASSLQREREWLGCWTCKVSGAVAKVFDRKTQRKRRRRWSILKVLIPCKIKENEKREQGRGREQETVGKKKRTLRQERTTFLQISLHNFGYKIHQYIG